MINLLCHTRDKSSVHFRVTRLTTLMDTLGLPESQGVIFPFLQVCLPPSSSPVSPFSHLLSPFLHLLQTLMCALVQASPSSPGRWANIWSASRRTATMWPTVPCPSWWSSPRSVMPEEPKSTAEASQKAGRLRCLSSSWTRGMQVCGVDPGKGPGLAGLGCFFAQAASCFHPTNSLFFLSILQAVCPYNCIII